MAEKRLNTRIVHKHETEANWLLSSLVPMQGELIVYDIDDNYDYERIKIGDGAQNVNDLPFVVAKPDWSQSDATAIDYIKNRTHYDDSTYTVLIPEAEYSLTQQWSNADSYQGHYFVSFDDTYYHNIRLYEQFLITVDGVEYSVKGSEFNAQYSASPIAYENGNMGRMYLYTEEPGTHTISIQLVSGNIKQLDEKFIPDTIARASDVNELSGLIGDTSVSEQIDEAILNSQSDWNQNDETAADYVKNRTHYVGITLNEIYNNTAAFQVEKIDDNTSVGIAYILASDVGITENSTDVKMTIILDGTEYTLTSRYWEGDSTIVFGNLSIINPISDIPYEDTGEPLLVVFAGVTNGSAYYLYYVANGETEHTIVMNLSQETVIQLDEKYIPDTIARISDISEQIVVDDVLSATSINPVQNKIVTTAINNLNTLVGDDSVSAQIERAIEELSDVGENVTDDVFNIDGVSVTAKSGAERFNDYANNIATGYMSHAEGSQTTASGYVSHAEGQLTVASAQYTHAEGAETKASADYAHSEGYQTEASGYYAHAEGYGAKATKNAAHAEGYYTTAASNYQHVQGRYNVPDAVNKYAHIVGNGWSTSDPSNAHTLDWEGNAWFAGDIYIGGTSQNDATKLTPGVMPNLLDNWYFVDPVNSQGLTSYPSGTYAIDRWFMRTSQGNIVDGGFQVSNVDGISFYGVTQALNNPTQYCGKTLTFSVKITEIVAVKELEIKIASGPYVAGVGTVINELKTITSPGLYYVTATIPDTLPNETLAVWITCRDATPYANYTIESVKLEFGSVSTLADEPAPNKADQVARCSNYDSSGAFMNALFATQAFVLKYVPKITSITLPVANWIFSSNAYYQDVALSCATATSKVDLQPTYAQLADWQENGLAFTTVSSSGAVRVWVTDVKPSADITIQATVQEVLEV